jgi:hypothetical protein
MVKIEKRFAHGYVKPVNRGIYFWNGDRENPTEIKWLDQLVYEALGDEYGLSLGHDLEGVTITIEIEKASDAATWRNRKSGQENA